MKLKSKQTGEIMEFDAVLVAKDAKGNEVAHLEYDSIQKFTDQWEDYEEGYRVYYLDYTGDVFDILSEVIHPEIMLKMKRIGNYFETKEEAEKTVEKLKALKRLKDKGFKIKGWKFTPDMKQIEGNYVKIEAEIPQILINEKDLDLLFGGEE